MAFQKNAIKRIVLHPFLFALYPVFALFAYNVGQVHFVDTLRSLAITLSSVTILLLVVGLLARNWHRAGLVVSLLVVLFFSFGHIYGFVNTSVSGNVLLLQANVLAAVWAALAILLPWFFLRKMKPGTARELTFILNMVSAAAVVLGLVPLASYTIKNLQAGSVQVSRETSPASQSGSAVTSNQSRPDIYYIILDGYGRSDVLRDLYGVDNQPMIDFLVQNGFYVADQSRSNYGRTQLSLPSSLNYKYVDEMLELNPDSSDTAPLEALTKQNSATEFLKSLGYRTVVFTNDYSSSDIQEADLVLKGEEQIKHFEQMLLRDSVFVLWMDQIAPSLVRKEIIQTFERLEQMPEVPGPKFVFAHIVLPHPPFVFDQDGKPVVPLGTGDGPYYYGTVESYLEGYRGQLLYANKLAEQAIRAILKNSKTPPVIILQGDHGPGAYWNFYSLEQSCLRERYSILNAYYLPGNADAGLYPSITPVNSFRVVLNAYFNQHLPLEDDRSYYSTWDHPYALTDVSGHLDECTPLRTGKK